MDKQDVELDKGSNNEKEISTEMSVINPIEQAAINAAKKEKAQLRAKERDDTKFAEAYSVFKSEQDDIIKRAESSIPSNCPTCQMIIHDAEDKSSMRKNSSCFTCHSESERYKTKTLLSEIENKGLINIGNMELSDYEGWLFGDEMGHRTLAVILSKLKTAGYNEYKPWQVSLAAASYSKTNYNHTDLMKTRHILERIPIAKIIENIPQDMEGIKNIVTSIKMAETELIESQPKKLNRGVIYTIAGVSAISVIIPILISKKR
jgi:hypothetical protein